MKPKIDISKLLKTELMDNLQHVPDIVFENIEKEIQIKRKRKFIIWFLFGILIGSTIIATYYNLNSDVAALKKLNIPKIIKSNNHSTTLSKLNKEDILLKSNSNISQLVNTRNDIEDKASFDVTSKTERIIIQKNVSKSLNLINENSLLKTIQNLKNTNIKPNNTVLIKEKQSLKLDNDTKVNPMNSLNLTLKKTVSKKQNQDYDTVKVNPMNSVNVTLKDVVSRLQNQPLKLDNDTVEINTIDSLSVTFKDKPLKKQNQLLKLDNDTVQDKSINDVDSLIGSKDIIYTDTTLNQGEFLHHEIQSETSQLKDNNFQSHWALTVFGGPNIYTISVFKPYFTSGLLSQQIFKSKGFEFGMGAEYKLNKHIRFSSVLSYNSKQSEFKHDLVITESDYLSNYQNNILIPVSNLDNSDNCNCFLAEDASLNYKVSSLNISVGSHFKLYETKRFDILMNLNVSTNFITTFKEISSTVIDFGGDVSDNFNSIRLGGGFIFDIKLNKRITLGLSPTYFMTNYSKDTKIHAEILKEVVIPIRFKINF